MHAERNSLEKSKIVHEGWIRSHAASLIGALVLAAATLAGAAKAQAACENYPVPDDFEVGDSIQCTEDSTSTDDIAIDASDLTISTAADNAYGIEIKHGGTGNIDVKTSGLTISTTATGSTGIDVSHTGSGNILIESQMDSITTAADSSTSNSLGIDVRHSGINEGDIVIRTVGTTIQTGRAGQQGSYGIFAESSAKGKVEVDISGGSITTLADVATGIIVWQEYGGPGRAGDTTLNIHNDASITTLGAHSPAVSITRRTDGNIKTDLGDVTISTMGENSFGVSALQSNGVDIDLVGDVEVNLLGGVSISTAGAGAHGVDAEHRGENSEVESHLVITARGRNTITTSGARAVGLRATRGLSGAGNTRIDLQDISIITEGASSDGIYGQHKGTSDIDIDVQGSTLTTKGVSSRGIYGRVNSGGEGGIDINVRNSFITTESTASANQYGDTLADGIYAYHGGSGDIDIDTERAVIETKGVFSRGVLAYHEGAGSINLDIRGGSVKTAGEFAYGIYGLLTKTDHGGTISIRTGNGNDVTTTGDNGHGILAYNYGTMDTRSIAIDVGGDIHASGTGAQGVRVGAVDGSNVVQRAAGFDAEGYRNQTVTVNGRVIGNAAGVYLAGGGRVVIGPQGSVGAASGIAILATGDTPGVDPDDSVIKPKLRVDMNLAGRRVAQVIGNDWIMNDGGKTTIAVNNVVLHDGANNGVVPNEVAANGAWNVRMREEGVTVDRTDPANWVISEPATGVVADRDFSTQDFTWTRRPRPPTPEPEPDPGRL